MSPAAPGMPDEPRLRAELLHQRWTHSHEEDTPTEMVFRPATFPFPRSRGRRSFELRPDGHVVESAPGPSDRPEASEGRWALEGGDRLVFYETDRSARPRVFTITRMAPDRLVVKKPDAPP